MTIRIIVVDDEPLARLGVISRLARHNETEVVGECGTGEEATAAISRLKPDLVFVDIEMPGITGIELVRRLPHDLGAQFVFLTAHEEYALDAFDVEALDYLLKPVDDERFDHCIQRARRAIALKRQEDRYLRLYEELIGRQAPAEASVVRRFTVRRGSDVSFIKAEEVDWIEGLGDYAGLHVQKRTHLIRETLGSLSEHLDRSQFLRVHRSAIVQIDRIVRVEPLANRDAKLTLRDGQILRASRNYSAALQDVLRNLRA